MADDLTIQGVNPQVQKKDNTGLYTGIGALAGAGAGYGIDRWTTKPQYSSFNDLVAEKQDTFNDKVKNASDDTKGVWEKAKQAREAGEKAGNDWESELAKYQEAHKDGDIIPDDNYKNLEKDLEAKKQAVTNKRAELENIEIEKIKTSSKGNSPKTLYEAYNSLAQQIYDAEVNGKGNLQEIADARKKYIASVVEKFEYQGTPEQIKAAKEAAAKEIEGYIQEMAGKHINRKVAVSEPELLTKYKKLIEAQKTQKNIIEQEIEKGFEVLAEETGKNDFKSLFNRDQNLASRQVRIQAKSEKSTNEALKRIKSEYSKILNKKPNEMTPTEALRKVLIAILKRENIKIEDTLPLDVLKEQYIAKLEGKEKAVFEKLLNSELNLETIDKAIENSDARLSRLSSAWYSVTGGSETIKSGREALESIKNRLTENAAAVEKEYGKGARITKNMKLLDSTGKEVKPTRPKIELSKLELKNCKIPETLSLEPISGAALTEEQIAQKAKEAVTDAMLKSEMDAQNAAQKAVDEARAKLPKGTAKTAEELKEAFIKEKGSKEDAIKKAGDSFKDDLAKLFEKKGFGTKMALCIAGGALVLGGLGYMMAPKSKNV